MVNNERVGCLHTHVLAIHTVWWLDVCCTRADPTVLNYSGLNIAFKLKGGRPWMLKLLVMAVYLIACSHVRISSCSASTPLFSYQRVWECFTGEYQGPAPQREGRRPSSNQGWSWTVGGSTELWETAGRRARFNPLIHTVTYTVCARLSDTAVQEIILPTPVRPFITVCPRVLFQPWQKPPLTFGLDSHGLSLLQYDVSRRPWPQLSREPVSQEKGASALCGALGSPLLGAFILMPHTKTHAKHCNVKRKTK